MSIGSTCCLYYSSSAARLDKWMIHVLGETEQDDTRLYHTAQSGMQFQMYEILISGIFYLIFWTAVELR
jgi:hypothetical protein